MNSDFPMIFFPVFPVLQKQNIRGDKMSKFLNYRLLKKVVDTSYILPARYYSIASQGSDNKPHYDVIIAGGGLVGLSLAASLGKHLSCHWIFIKFHHVSI